ncbi:hypothetical protein Tco_1390380, partial [Tanacetum coccineum]
QRREGDQWLRRYGGGTVVGCAVGWRGGGVGCGGDNDGGWPKSDGSDARNGRREERG